MKFTNYINGNNDIMSYITVYTMIVVGRMFNKITNQ